VIFQLEVRSHATVGVELTGIGERDGGAKVIADELLDESRKEGAEGVDGQEAERCCCCE